MNEAYVVIGRIVRPHALAGEVLVKSLSDFPGRFAGLRHVVLFPEGEAGREGYAPPGGPAASGVRDHQVESVRTHSAGAILKMAGIASVEEAEGLRGLLVGVPREEAVPLGPGEYYAFQLVGLEVLTTAGESLGRLREVLRYPANDVYEVWDAGRGREVLLPATAEVIREVNLDRGVMIVRLLDGLVD